MAERLTDMANGLIAIKLRGLLDGERCLIVFQFTKRHRGENAHARLFVRS